MNEKVIHNFSRILEAIEYQCFKKQVTIDEVAREIHLTTSEFQQLFIDFAGVSYEKFLEYISVHHARQMLGSSQPTLFEPAYNKEHSPKKTAPDSWLEIEEMTSGEIGEELAINYSFSETIFGTVLVASTHKGICYLIFSENYQLAISELINRFPKATITQQLDDIQQNALQFFTDDWSQLDKIKLHLKGTDFQLKVWNALLKIPKGHLTTYGNLAKTIHQPKAARAVGTAIGSNPIAFLIPCHRVIQTSGAFGGYMWGTARKTAIIGWEAGRVNDVNRIK